MIKLDTDIKDVLHDFNVFCKFIHFDMEIKIDIRRMDDFIEELEKNTWDYSKFDSTYLETLCEKDPVLFSLIYAYSKYIKT